MIYKLLQIPFDQEFWLIFVWYGILLLSSTPKRNPVFFSHYFNTTVIECYLLHH